MAKGFEDLSKKENKTMLVGFNVTPTRKAEIIAFCEKRKWPMSEFLRRAVEDTMAKVIKAEK